MQRQLKNIFKIFVLLTLVSCSDRQSSTDNQPTSVNSFSINSSATPSKDTIHNCEPSETFITLVKYMDSCSYHIDSTTIFKSARQFDSINLNQEFYSNTFIHSLLKDSAVFEEGSQSLASVNYNPIYDLNFGKVNCIWTYSWRIPDAEDGLKRRGTVEEWIFDCDSSAKFAYDFLINEYKKIGFPFCKTPGFYLQCGKYLYLFHSNHTGVGYRHKPFHKWLTKRCIST